MALKNTKKQFGSLNKFFHWSLFILVFVQVYLVNRREFFPEDAPEKLQYILLHESFGLLIFFFGLGFIFVSQLGERPHTPPSSSTLERLAAKSVHGSLFLLILLMPITGALMVLLSPYDLMFFGWQIPNFLTANESRAHFFHETHSVLAFITVSLLLIHIAAAVFHHWIRKDNVLKRMLPFVHAE